ncbi:MAG: universal stress protein [Pseudomonadota bacterium]
MGLYDKILVAVDGSDASLHALSESIKLSYWVRGSVCAIFVAPSYEGDLSLTGVKNLETILTEPCENVLAKIRETVEQIDASIQALCLEGEPFKKIMEYAEKEGFDLIVAGVEKKNTLYRTLIKGVAEKIIRYGSKDILVIPQNTSIGWDKILVSIDKSQHDGIAVKKAIEITKAYGGELLVLDHNINKKEVINGINKLYSKIVCKTIIKNGNSPKVILDAAFENNTDLIIMSSLFKKSIRNLIFKDTIEKVVLSSTCPVLVVSESHVS